MTNLLFFFLKKKNSKRLTWNFKFLIETNLKFFNNFRFIWAWFRRFVLFARNKHLVNFHNLKFIEIYL